MLQTKRYKTLKNYKSFDLTLILIYAALLFIGWLAIFSSSYTPSNESINIFDLQKIYGKQLLWISFSILLSIVILTIDSRVYHNFAYYIYLATLLFMVLVIFIGTEISGAKAWIKIGSFSVQPTEFAKFATALALAKFFNEGKTRFERRNLWLIAFLFIFLPIVIIILQKDTGSALVFLSFLLLFYREGLSGNIILIGIVAIILFLLSFVLNELYAIAIVTTLFVFFWILHRKSKNKLIRNAIIFISSIIFIFSVNFLYDKVLQPHQKIRISTLLGQTSDPLGADFNLNQSKIAIGSGGFAGKGYLHGTQTKLKFVPEQSTDFIFCSIGEEFGFIGSFIIVSLFSLLIYRILFLAERHRTPFVRYYGYGVAGVIFFHFMINLGMTIGFVPIIGIPLPFLSYGGSSLIGFTILLFIFIRLANS